MRDANIGIATGQGIYVVDVDTYKGAKVSDLGNIPETLTVRTGGGGLQFYFAVDPDLKLGNTTNKLGKWIDTRGEGGYVVAPGSNHLSGGRYEWLNDAPIAPLPAHLIERLEKKPKASPLPPAERVSQTLSAAKGDTPYGLAALDDECRTLAGTHEGGRNDQLNRSAYLMGNLVAGDELTESTALRELRDAALRCGLGEREIDKTLQSGLNDGMFNPRKAPERVREIPPTPVVESTQAQPTTLEEANQIIAHMRRENEQLRNEVEYLRPFKEKYELHKRLDKIPNKVADPTTKDVFAQCKDVFDKRTPDSEGGYHIVAEYMAKPIGSTDQTVLDKLKTLAANNLIAYESKKDEDGHNHVRIQPRNFTIEALMNGRPNNHGGKRVALHKGCGGLCVEETVYRCTKCGVRHLPKNKIKFIDAEKWQRWQTEDAMERAEQPAEADESQSQDDFGVSNESQSHLDLSIPPTEDSSQVDFGIPSIPAEWREDTPCSTCGCKLTRMLGGFPCCVRCYLPRGYHTIAAQVDALYPRKKPKGSWLTLPIAAVLP